jgi:hypothetical protein
MNRFKSGRSFYLRKPPPFVSTAMFHFSLSALLEYVGHDMSPVAAVLAFFVFGYLVVGLPMHFRQGAASRDVWGTAAGVTMAALYGAFIVGVYPLLHLHGLHVPPPAVTIAH